MMTDRKEYQQAKAVEQSSDDSDNLDIPMINRTPSEARDDEGDYLPLPHFICRGIGEWHQEKPSLWSRLRNWIRGGREST
jgi:hypothetical protein